METEGSLPLTQEAATCPNSEPHKSIPFPHPHPIYQRASPSPRQLWMFGNVVIFYAEESLTPRPTPNLEDQLLSTLRNCSYPPYWRSFLHP